jgi:hypothetical protein
MGGETDCHRRVHATHVFAFWKDSRYTAVGEHKNIIWGTKE